MCAWAWKFWMLYVNQKHLDGLDWKLLEIKIPRDVFKSPLATEIASAAFLQGGGIGNWYVRNIKGNLPIFFSLEIASIEGNVRFFIRTQKKFIQLIQNNFYSQYPNIEINEAEDYVTKIFYDHRSDQTNLWACDFFTNRKFTVQEEDKGKKLEKLEMKADYIPIKTYVDFEMNKDPKEEFKHDPLTPMLEWLGSLGKNEFGWYQIMVQDEDGSFNNKKFDATYVNPLDHKHLTLKELAALRIKQIREVKVGGKYKKGDIIYDEYGNAKKKRIKVKQEDGSEKEIEVDLTYGKDDEERFEKKKPMDLHEEEKKELEAIGKKLSKPTVRAAIRVMYLAKKENFNGQNIQSVLSVFKHMSQPGYNTFGLSPSDPYDYDWQDTFKKRKPWRKEEFFEAYVEREAFYPHIEVRNKNSKPKNIIDIDDWWDWALFKRSLGFRKIGRIMWEGFLYPTHHPDPDNVFVLNLEELATLWHLPGAVATTPGLRRVDSVKGDAPNNLPI